LITEGTQSFGSMFLLRRFAFDAATIFLRPFDLLIEKFLRTTEYLIMTPTKASGLMWKIAMLTLSIHEESIHYFSFSTIDNA